ncbi:MAG: RHS repeat-associated core domain-containing protein [Acidobacteriota bacterium]
MSTSTPVSNATNFTSYLESGVDPRTGQHSFSVTLVRLRPRNQTRIERAIKLSFSPMQTTDQGYGRGWSLATSQLEIDRSLHLGDGRSVHCADGSGNVAVGELLSFEDQKLDDFFVRRVEEDRYHVVFKDGVIEELVRGYGDSVARLQRIIFPNGESFAVEFGHSHLETEQLTEIRDPRGKVVLRIDYDGYPETITTCGVGGATAVWNASYSNGALQTLTVPHDAAESEPHPHFRFDQDEVFSYPVLTEIVGPTGRRESIHYDLSSGHGFIVSGDRYDVPYVRRHEIHPGGGQPPIIKSYTYDDSNRNFLGFPNENGWGENQDNLYLTPGDYQYWSHEDLLGDDQTTPVVSTRRTYNSYHLIVSEVTTRGSAETTTSYLYNQVDGVDFYAQPANVQLPREISTTFKDLSASASRTETTVISTDSFGNTLSRTEPTGVTTTTEYYPPEGIAGECPPDPLGHFARFPRHVVESSADGSRTLDYCFTEIGVAVVEAGLPERHVVLHRELQNGVAETVYSSVDASGTDSHGLLESTTTKVGGKATRRDFHYTFPSAFTVDTRCTITGFDGEQSIESRVLCRLTGKCLEQIDPLGVQSAYAYDALGRLIRTVDAVGTAGERVREFLYEFPTLGGVSWSTETGPDGIRRRSSFDGEGRLLTVEQQDDWGTHDPVDGYTGAFHVTERYEYDALGQLRTEQALDYVFQEEVFQEETSQEATLQEEVCEDATLEQETSEQELDDARAILQTLSHTSTYSYDDWGGRSRTEQSSGRVEIDERDPVRLTARDGLEGLGSRVSVFNLFQMPVSCQVRDATDAPYCETTATYDGFGRMVSSTSPTGATTTVSYDAFNRITGATPRGGRRLLPTYAEFSTGPWVAELTVEDPNGGASHQLATRTFDGLGRITQRVSGGRQIDYSFDPGSMRPARVTPVGLGDTITLTYDETLAQRLTSVTASDLDEHYVYDMPTGRLESVQNPRSRQAFDYSPTGLPWTSTLTGPTEGRTLDVEARYSLRGRLVRRTDSDGNELHVDYDEYGRPLQTRCNEVTARSRYDAHGRIAEVVTELMDGTRQKVTSTYDDFHRTTRRDLVIEDRGGEVHREALDLVYDVENRVTERRRSHVGRQVLEELFTYDTQSRLVDYQVSGDEPLLPVLGGTLRVVRQVFSYSILDAILECTTTFADGSSDRAVYHYLNPSDPTQVSAIEHDHEQLPDRIDLSYDAQGHRTATSTAAGPWTFRFSSAGRLIEAIDPAQRLIHYDYDAIGRLGAIEASDGATRSFNYLGEQVLAEVRGTAGRYFVSHQGLPVAEGESGSSPRLLATDLVGSVTGSTDAGSTGAATHKAWSYLPYGGAEGADSTRRFTGELQDDETGFYLLGNGTRVYDPATGIFLSADGWSPLELGGVNPYIYCKGNPINLVDPSGHFSTGADLGLNIFCFILDAVILGVAIAAAPVSGGGSLAAGAAIVGASLGLVSDTLGIAADSMSIKDSRDGVTDRADTIQNLGLASGSFGLAAMAVDVASMAGEIAGVAKIPSKAPSGGHYAQGSSHRVLMVGAEPLDADGLRWKLLPEGDGDLWSTDLTPMPDRPLPRKGAPVYRYDAPTDAWSELKLRSGKDWAGPALDFFGRSDFVELGRRELDGGRKTVARGIGLFSGTAGTASGIALLSNTTWEVANRDENETRSMDLYSYLEDKLPITPGL